MNNLSYQAAAINTAAANNQAVTEYRMFRTMAANDWILQALERPDPVPLWLNLWYEGEVACLFADTNVGKSIYAIQIAEAIAQKQTVLYFDFEMSDKQFQMRYTDDETGMPHCFDMRFHRVEFSRIGCFKLDVPTIIRQIEYEVEAHDCRVIILDNISWICNNAESGDAAGELMQLLIDMKRRKKLSILVLAHTPKRAMYSPLTQNSLAGSKRIANFLDSMFAIGISRLNPASGRYIKQIKTRSSELLYGEENVITGELIKDGDFIEIRHTGYADERDLTDVSAEEAANVDSTVRSEIETRLKEGMKYRNIASELGVSTKTVCKISKELKRA